MIANTRITEVITATMIALMLAFLASMVAISYAVDVDAETLKASVRDYVETVAEEKGLLEGNNELIVRIEQVPRAPYSFDKTDSIDDILLEPSSNLERFFSSQALVRVKLTSQLTGATRYVGVPVKIALKTVVFEAKTSIMPGESLSAKDFKKVRRESTSQFHRLLPSDIDITQFVAVRVLRPGEVLTSSYLVKPYAVKRNAIVRVVLKGASGLKVMLEGKSLQDGRIGQRVRVRSRLNKQKYYMGKVVSENRVLVKI